MLRSKAKLTITATGEDTQKVSKEVTLCCLNFFDDVNGTFVLNEGNMTTENGSLTYVTADGYVFDDAYKTVNGSELGNVAQDMAFYGDKIYIITQNGDVNAVGKKFENDGMLIVVNAKTLKRKWHLARKIFRNSTGLHILPYSTKNMFTSATTKVSTDWIRKQRN